MTLHITAHRDGFPPGLTWITTPWEAEDNTGIGLGVLHLGPGETWSAHSERETAWLLMAGQVEVSADGIGPAVLERRSLFDEPPQCLHVAAGTAVRLSALEATEFTVYETDNVKPFAPRLYTEVTNEHRGKGQVGDACYRLVRTIFDRTNADPNAELVLGEVITFPGRWSSYPPHHHPQPEIYHYRFTHPQGYGHAELGDTVLKVRHCDTVKILDGLDHPQCAAPGYGMYYAWVIRHLPGQPYTMPEFGAEHRWVLNADASVWQPKES